MSKLVQLFVFLITIHTTTANAENFYINVRFRGPDNPTRLVLTDKYCISNVDNVIKLNNKGVASFKIDTSGGVFSKCGWVHSSATFEVQGSEQTRLFMFEFYKPAGADPDLKILSTTKGITCSYGRLFLGCDGL